MILVTGATGQIGKRVTQHLIELGAPVRTFVRNENRLGSLKGSDLEVAVGTFEDMSSIEKAVKGVDRLLLIGRDNPEQTEQHNNVIKAAEKHGVKHIVKLSAFGASKESPIELMRAHAETESQIKESKLTWTFLRPHLYMQNLLRFGDSVAQDNYFSAPMGTDAYSLVDIRDIAETAAAILNDGGHISKVYTLTSPYPSTYNQIANYLSEILNHSIDYHSVSSETFYQSLIAEGLPSWRAFDLAHIAEAYPNDRKTLIANDIENILDRPARSIQTFLNNYKGVFQQKE